MMQFFQPSYNLAPFVKEYVVVNFEQDIREEVFYPSGFVDFVVNISDGRLTTVIGERSIPMPKLEILGQLTVPTRLHATKDTSLLVGRVYPYANSLFFPNPMPELKNESVDFSSIMSSEAAALSGKMDGAKTIQQKVAILDGFFTERLTKNQAQIQKVKMIAQICHTLCRQPVFDIHRVADDLGLSDRYIQKLFEITVGLTPRSFFNANRFHKTAERIRLTDERLTAISHDCGYFDQAHLIREFRKFTGITPSEARKNKAGKTQAIVAH